MSHPGSWIFTHDALVLFPNTEQPVKFPFSFHLFILINPYQTRHQLRKTGLTHFYQEMGKTIYPQALQSVTFKREACFITRMVDHKQFSCGIH